MSDNKTHMAIGAGVSIINYVSRKNTRGEPITLNELFGVGLMGAAAATLPDIIDPPTNPNHRGYGHSLVTGTCLLDISSRIENNPNLSNNQKDVISSSAMSYLSHLFLDADTPKGLPILKR